MMKQWVMKICVLGSCLLFLAVQGCSSVGGTVTKSFEISGDVETNTTIEHTSQEHFK